MPREHLDITISVYIVITLNCNNFTVNSAQFGRIAHWQKVS